MNQITQLLAAIVSFVLCNQVLANAKDAIFTKNVKGQHINISCEQDVVSFSSKFSKEYITELTREGYHGFAKVKGAEWDKLVEQQNYVEILKIIWTEKDLDVAIAHLEPEAKKGHAILMFELSRTLYRKMKAENNIPIETLKVAGTWYLHGLLTTLLDIACNTDNSTQAAIGMLRLAYQPGQLIPQTQLQQINGGELYDSFIKNWELSASYPSPKWVTYHGLAIFQGKDSLLPETEWNEKRAIKFRDLKSKQ
jgi:hypothetical protein